MSADEPDAARADVVSAVRGTRRDFAATIETGATRDSVWQAWTDVRDWGRWDLGLREAGLDAPEAGLERDADRDEEGR